MYQAAVVIHILAAVTWLGGMLFLVMVMLPLARSQMAAGPPGDALGPSPALTVLRDAAKKFLPVAWGSMIVLGVTGAFLAWDHWGVRADTFFTGRGHFLETLQIKSGLFLVVLVLSVLHDFWLGPKMLDRLDAARQAGQPPPRGFVRTFVLMEARVNLVLVPAIVVLAVILIRP